MALRIIPELSPRLIVIPAPDVEVTMQALLDELRAWEEQPQNMAYPRMILATGKEDLGGSVFVGLTNTLQNAQLYFEARSTPSVSGESVTTGDTRGQTCIASAATFQTDGVQRGYTVFNATTAAMATVLSVDSEIQLTSLPLSGGARADWQIGDIISIYPTVQCDVTGGNLVAVDAAGAAMNAILESPNTNYVRTSSASATLQELADIQFSSFGGGIWYDEVDGVAGTAYPTGTERQPSDNFTDGLSIATTRGFNTFFVRGDATIDAGLDYTDYVFAGQGQNLSVFTITAAATVTNCAFSDAEISGTLDGGSNITLCTIDTLSFVSGVIEHCLLNNVTITLGGSDVAHFIDCESGVPGMDTPTIDMGGSGQDLTMRGYSGGITLTNLTGAQDVSIDLLSGQVRLDLPNLTGGTIVVRGTGKVVDDATGDWVGSGTYSGMTLINETVFGEMMQAMWQVMGLDKNNPLTVTPTARDAGDVSQVITGDQITTSTVTRQ